MRFMTNKVLVIGGANLDIKAKTIGRHVAATSNPASIISKPGGVARNIAHNLAKLGADVSLLSVVGDDPAGAMLLEATAKAGVDIALVRKLPGTTGSYFAILDQNGELVTAVNDMHLLDKITPSWLDWGLIEQSTYVVADCNLPLPVLLVLAKRAGTKLIVEPVSIPKCVKLKEMLKEAKIFLATPNLDQLGALTGSWSVDSGAAKLLEMGLQNVAIHAGAKGAYLAQAGAALLTAPSQARAIADVTGAGDAATAGLVFGLLQGAPLANAIGVGQEMAARVIASTQSTLD